MTYTLTGRYPLGDLTGRDGEHLRFTPSTTVVGPDVIVLPAPVPVKLDSDGGFSIELVGNDDPDYAPTGWVWVVQELMDGGRPPWAFELTADADISDLTPVAVPDDYDLYARRDDLAAETAARVAGDLALRGRWPVVTIVTDGDAPILDTETYVPGDYTITETDGGVVHSGALDIRGRGNSTWDLPKKPYRLKLAAKTSLLGMTANQKNWALLANYLDDAKINTHLAFTLGAQLVGLDWTPQYRVVEVVLNGDFIGLYQLTDLVRMEAGRIDETIADADTGAGLTGGYLIEADNKEAPGMPDEGTDPGWHTTLGQWIIYDTPADDELTTAQRTYLQGYVNDFEAALFGAGFISPVTGWRAYADEASFVDWYIVQELFANCDSALYSSCKLWKARSGKLHMGPLWDFDASLGDTSGYQTSAVGFYTRAGGWLARMFEDSTFWDAVALRWPEVIALLGDYEAWIDRLIDSETAAIARDDKRWTLTTYTPLQADNRKRWLADRIAWLGGQLTAAPSTYSDTYSDTYA